MIDPSLSDGTYLVVTSRNGNGLAHLSEALAFFREAEGMSLVLPRAAALEAGFDDGPPMKLISLNVYSSLEGVGLTAAVSSCLAGHGIACNMIAAFHHDHLLVPEDRAEEALALLAQLQIDAR